MNHLSCLALRAQPAPDERGSVTVGNRKQESGQQALRIGDRPRRIHSHERRLRYGVARARDLDGAVDIAAANECRYPACCRRCACASVERQKIASLFSTIVRHRPQIEQRMKETVQGECRPNPDVPALKRRERTDARRDEGPIEQRHPREPAGEKQLVDLAVEPRLDIGYAGRYWDTQRRRAGLFVILPLKQPALNNRAEVSRQRTSAPNPTCRCRFGMDIRRTLSWPPAST